MSDVLELLAAGESFEKIVEEYPSLTIDMIKEALEYSARIMRGEHYVRFEDHVEYVSKGVKNSRVARLAREQKAILVTRDSDFVNTLTYPPGKFYGIVILQIHPPKSELLIRTLPNFLTKVNEFEGKLFLIEKVGFKVIE